MEFFRTAVPPVIREGPDKVVVRRGETAQLDCDASGHPAPRIRWVKDGRLPVSTEGRTVVMDSGAVVIRRTQVQAFLSFV